MNLIKYHWDKKQHNNELYEEIRDHFFHHKIVDKVQIKYYPDFITLRGNLDNSYKFLVICNMWGYGHALLSNFDAQRGFDEWEAMSITDIYIYINNISTNYI